VIVPPGSLRDTPGPSRPPDSRLHQMGEFVQQDVVDHPGRHRLHPVRQPDGPRSGGTRAPAVILVAHPGNRPWLGRVAQLRQEEALGQFIRSPGQSLVAAGRAGPRFARQHLGDHVLDVDPFVGLGHPLGNQHNDRIGVAVGRHGTFPPRAAPDHHPRRRRGIVVRRGGLHEWRRLRDLEKARLVSGRPRLSSRHQTRTSAYLTSAPTLRFPTLAARSVISECDHSRPPSDIGLPEGVHKPTRVRLHLV
jgi:hypothetical protein